jgi:hypothetical protein
MPHAVTTSRVTATARRLSASELVARLRRGGILLAKDRRVRLSNAIVLTAIICFEFWVIRTSGRFATQRWYSPLLSVALLAYITWCVTRTLPAVWCLLRRTTSPSRAIYNVGLVLLIAITGTWLIAGGAIIALAAALIFYPVIGGGVIHCVLHCLRVIRATIATEATDRLLRIEDRTIQVTRVFLSYAHEDADAARRIYTSLSDVPNCTIWFDEASLRLGERWESTIRREMRESDYVLLLLSSRSRERAGFCHREVRLAVEILELFPEASIYLLPVRLDECDMPLEVLRGLHRIDLFRDWDAGLAVIRQTLVAGKNAHRPVIDAS